MRETVNKPAGKAGGTGVEPGLLNGLAYFWGIGGVILLLGFAVFRLSPMAFALSGFGLSPLHWAALLLCILYMAYAEGYKGFHQAFSPRVVVRAAYLRDNPRPDLVLLAPLFCMGYIHATRKRQILSISLTLLIVVFVLIARQLPQPWRGILDAGVVVGLTLGIASILGFMIQNLRDPQAIKVSAELPVRVEAQGGHA